jgi:microcystin-dependent protein
MASTYTSNLGVEKPGSGDQAGTWGTTVNTNMDIVDRASNGVGALTVSGATATLTTTDGALSDGQYKVLHYTSASEACTITISPNTADKLYFVHNASGYSLTFTQGSGGNVTVSTGTTKVIYADGAGATAKVTDFTNIIDIAGVVNATTFSIDGTEVTSTAAELNILDGVTADTAEINILDGVTANTAEINILDGLTATTAELNYVDGVTSNIQTQIDNVTSTAMPTGALVPYAGTSAPSGFLLCYGQEVSRTTYASLFSAIGTTYGTGDGSTTFNLPDLRGRAVAGQDDMGGSSANRLTGQSGGVNGDTLGGTGGNETHTLTEAELAAHTHTVNSVTVYGISGTGSNGQSASGLSFATPTNVETITEHATTQGTSTAHTASLANTGSGSAHNNVQPTIILNYIIKT